MSAAQILDEIRRLPRDKQDELIDMILDEFDGLTAEQAAELDRRVEEALKHPERGIPAEEVFRQIERKYSKQ